MSNQKGVYGMLQEASSWRKGLVNPRTGFITNIDEVFKTIRQVREDMMAGVNVSREVVHAMRNSAYEFLKDYRDFRKSLFSMREDLQQIMQSVTPYVSLYKEIIDSLDEETYEKINDIWEEDNPEDNLEEELTIIRPYFYIAAVNLNTYKNVTEFHIHQSETSEEEVAQWKKYIAPLLNGLIALFITWASSDTPIKDMNFMKQIEKIIELINEHPSEEEKMDIKTIDDKVNDLNKADIKESFPS